MTMKLYDGPRSPNARKVRLLAKELDLPLEYVRLDFAKGEYRAPAYLAMNPNGKVPLLDDDGFLLWESSAILCYLASKKPERSLVPSAPKERAKLDQWMFFWTAHPEASLLALAGEKLIKPFLGQKGHDPGVVAIAEEDAKRYLAILDAQAAGKEHLLGALSVLDFAVGPWLEGLARVDLSLEPYPALAAWLARMQSKPYWKDA